MNEAQRLRAELKKRRQAVTNKINRIKRETGANISGSDFDPRRKAGIEKNYNVRQLKAHIAELNNFMRRGNQFVSGAKGAPLPRGQFLRYKRLEAQANAVGERHAASIGSLQTPLGMSVRQVKAAIPQGHGSAVIGPFKQFDRESTDIASAKSLKVLSAGMLRVAKASYLPQQLNVGRQSLQKSLMAMGEVEEWERISALSDYQFDALWNGTTYAEITFLRYGMSKSGGDDDSTRKERWQNRVVESATDDAREFIQWAEQLPKERPTTG